MTSSEATVHVVGSGIVARRLRRLLHARHVAEVDPRRAQIPNAINGDLAILAQGCDHAEMAAELIERGVHVVTVGDGLDDTRALFELDAQAVASHTSLVIGAALSPGLSELIARHLANQLHEVDEIHVAMHGTSGPSCARMHHRSLSRRSVGWHDGEWADYLGGSGRELCWFPEPVGAKDCYRAQIPSPVLLHHSFPEVSRISARRSARRRDRLTARLPMLVRPHQEGGIGALRVEVRGNDASGGRQCLIAGVAELVGSAAAATAAAFATMTLDGQLPVGVVIAGDQLLPTIELLRNVQSFGVRLQEFTGVPQPG